MSDHSSPRFTLSRTLAGLFVFVIIFALGGTAGWYICIHGINLNSRNLDINQTREVAANEKFKFINPLLTCDLTYKKDLEQFMPLKEKIVKVINEHVKVGDLATASIYFDTRDGKWLGINTNEQYFPASLMKVPLLVAYLKSAETHPDLLAKKLWYDGKFNLNSIEYFKATSTLAGGHYYSMDELLRRMIVNSGNNSTILLYNNIELGVLEGIYNDLGINLPASEDLTLADYMTVKSYSSFFRILYNASYLSRAMSEKALSILSQSQFFYGIRAGVPEGTVVSDKFGERSNSSDPLDPVSDKQLHDCGIIYYPGHPYLLCVMTKGNNFDKLASVIKDISHNGVSIC
ncbi:MAG: serine hydrolase [Candidatus Magasanikbacteria bacterium]|nr:serine hydrolase [Candidatus Magasanikbacteria bacterium]